MANKVIKSLEQAPLADMVRDLGIAIARAQLAMDTNSVEIAKLMAGTDANVTIGGNEFSLLELGFAPTFYQITETMIEAKVAFSSAESHAFTIGATVGVNVGFFAATVNASYSQKYSFDSSGSSSITARLVTVPPPTIFNERLRESMEPGDEDDPG